jgi:hypothetical protein
MGLSWMPSCLQLKISQNSSIVPNPPGSAMKPSLNRAINALRSCTADDVQLADARVRDLGGRQRFGDDADDLAAKFERAIGYRAHEADAATAVHDPEPGAHDRLGGFAGNAQIGRIAARAAPAEDADAPLHARAVVQSIHPGLPNADSWLRSGAFPTMASSVSFASAAAPAR